MALTLQPRGDAAFEFFNLGTSIGINVPQETAIILFRRKSIFAPAIAQNFLNLYSFADVGREGKARFGSLRGPKHQLSKRNRGCVWSPKKCGTSLLLDEIDTCPVELQQEQCVDALWGECWEKILGVGNDKYQIDGTSEGSALLGVLVDEIYRQLGNDYYNLTTFGLNPIIEDANTNGWYRTVGISDDEWACFYDQQQACGGIITQIDALKTEGLANFNVTIYDADVEGSKYVGDPTELFQRLEDGMSHEMEVLADSEMNGGLVIGVTKGIFNAYRNQLIQIYQNIPASLQLLLSGSTFCDDCESRTANGVLSWNGFWVVRMSEWTLLDRMTGTYTHRAALMVPGVLGLAYDVSPVGQFDGMGMEITNWRRAPLKGKTYFDTTFRVGTAILDTDLIVHACNIQVPA